MKNKKLFAILTLVCFMMTLMPVAAFAADPADKGVASDNTSYVYTEDTNVDVDENVKVELDLFDRYGNQDAETTVLYTWVTKKGSTTPVDSVAVNGLPKTASNVYKLTGNIDNSYTYNVTFYVAGTYVIHASVNEPTVKTNGTVSTATQFDNEGSVVEVTAESVSSRDFVAGVTLVGQDDYKILNEKGEPATVFVRYTTKPVVVDGVYAYAKDGQGHELFKIKDTNTVVYKNGDKYYYEDTSKVANVVADDLNRLYIETVEIRDEEVAEYGDETLVRDGYTVDQLYVGATNVEEKEVKVRLYNGKNMQYLAGQTLKIEPVGAINVDKETVTTNRRGEASFKVSGKYNGNYKVYVSCGQFGFTVNVQVGSASAVSIKCTEEPTRPVDVLGEKELAGVTFTMYDVNGNKVAPEADHATVQGWVKALNSDETSFKYYVHNAETAQTVDATGYVAVVSQPSASKITNKDLTFNGTTIVSKKPITAEGTYEFKVVLDNGAYALAKVEVKEFKTPVSLHVEYPEAIELGATIVPANGKIYWLDENGTKKNAKTNAGVKVDLAATGYAVANFNARTGELTAKTDEKYIGDTITITAVDQRYNLVATDEIKVANDAKELKFEKKSLDVNINNEVKVQVVDQDGTAVSLGNENNIQNASFDISYVILEKPEGSRVYAVTKDGSNDNLRADGYFTMNLTSNKVGNVAVQAVLKYSYMTKDASTNKQVNVVKYYTGTQIFAVGNGSTGDVVVMSIGSHEIVINDAVKTIDAAPMIQNDRTFVPFRALAEAFGAEVAYDEATQAVTAKLNGVEVVMTIGSATYTVNGAEKTMDVAPFINGSRTMVPVRFAAEAFGIKVIPTYNPDGTTADILFNL